MTYNPQFKPHWDILKASRWLLYVSIAVLLRYQSDIQSCVDPWKNHIREGLVRH